MSKQIIDVMTSLRCRMMEWGEKETSEQVASARSNFAAIVGTHPSTSKIGVSKDAPKPLATASEPKADKVQGEVDKSPQVAPAEAPASPSPVSEAAAKSKTAEPAPKKKLQAKNNRRKGGAK